MNVFLKWIVWTRHISLVVWSVRLTLNKYLYLQPCHNAGAATEAFLLFFIVYNALQWKGVLRDMLNHHSYHHHWRSLDIINTIWSVESSREPNGACIKMIHRQGALVALKETLLGTKYKCNAIQAHMVIFPFVKYCKIWALRDPPHNIGLDGDCVKY